jgi:hypothetical protein
MIWQQTVCYGHILPRLMPLPTKNRLLLSGLLYCTGIGYFYIAPANGTSKGFFAGMLMPVKNNLPYCNV